MWLVVGSIDHATFCRMNAVSFVNSEGFGSAFDLGKLVESTVGSGSPQVKAAQALKQGRRNSICKTPSKIAPSIWCEVRLKTPAMSCARTCVRQDAYPC